MNNPNISTIAIAPPKRVAQTIPIEVLRIILFASHNGERSKHKLPPYAINEQLNASAQRMADDMAKHPNRMSHAASDGSLPWDRIKDAGYRYQWAGENIAKWQSDAATVVADWMDSSGHRAAILSEQYKEVGFGVAYDGEGRPYWCADFGSQS